MVVYTVVVQGQAPAPTPTATLAETLGNRYKPPANIRIGSRLYQLALAQQEGKLDSTARSMGARLDGHRVLVSIQARPGQAGAASAAVVAAGGKISGVIGDYVGAYVPAAALLSLAEDPSVARVDSPTPAAPAQAAP